ncbi:hypothetical protein [Streptomyces lateritius]|uniref:hypothetical protein n=1 Tax=Streptomyces lateritius TaxID=67313 RepID=UPI001C8B5FC4|nr:hypothetical protein [Streptomyces lateritius]MBX9425474.1 hypothetical protein [Streptomyces lateritius]
MTAMQNDIDPRCIVESLNDDMATAQLRRNHEATGDLAVESLPTVYRGITFRSALEASWAATLDSLAIAWEYEPETVTLPSGARYLPDFRLPEIGCWLEVKGDGVPRVEKAVEFGQSLACDCPRFACSCRWPGGELVLIGRPPRRFQPDWDPEYDSRHYWAKAIAARNHGGHPRWTSTRRTRAWLGLCVSCQRATWFDSPHCRACKRRLIGSHGLQSGTDEIRFIRITGIALPTDDTDHDTPAA